MRKTPNEDDDWMNITKGVSNRMKAQLPWETVGHPKGAIMKDAMSTIQRLRKKYRIAKAAPIGASTKCPMCGTPVTKTADHNVFCRDVCKKRYWKSIDILKTHRDPN